MASPQSERLAITPSPASRALRSPLTDDAIWRRLREAGFDEDSIKRRDKASLIAYIAKLEAEIFDYQHQMGLLILEKKEWLSKYEQIKNSAKAAEIISKRDQAAHSSAVAEAKKREDSLRKALGVEKECIVNLEKALHEMRAESAETKVAAESKLTEARRMAEDAQEKFIEAKAKLSSAESLQAEASRFHRAAERKLQEVEAREDDLRRRIMSHKSECDAKEKEIVLERQSLCERQKILQQGQERLLDAQALLNQREDYMFSRSQELDRVEKDLEASRENFEKEQRALNEEKSILELNVASLSSREEVVNKREALLNKKEQELLIFQEKVASKESDEVQRLVAIRETDLKLRKFEFEAELERIRKLAEDEIEKKRRAWELKEVDLRHQEDLIQGREHDLEVQSRALMEKEKDVMERLNLLEEKEKNLNVAENEVELKKILLEKEKEDICKTRLELQKVLDSLEDKKKQVVHAEENLEAMKNDSNELMILEIKLKEEIDAVRAQNLEFAAEADELKAEKAKFETEWELIDEKREELRREAELVAEERLAVSKFLKDERDSLKLEKDALRDQYRRDVESLRLEQEAFMIEMEHEHSEWFSKMQQERTDLLLDIEMQKQELENSIQKRREEIESYLKDMENVFGQEMKKERHNINILRETVAKDLEHVALEMKRLESERVDINLDRERRDKEWAELNNSIEELKIQRGKLEKQRELLHADSEKIHAQIEQLKKLEDLKIISDGIASAKMHHSRQGLSKRKIYTKRSLKPQTVQTVELGTNKKVDVANGGLMSDLASDRGIAGASPSSSTPFAWIKRCADLVFKTSPEKLPVNNAKKSLISDPEDANLMTAGQLNLSHEFKDQAGKANEKIGKNFHGRHSTRGALEEPKVILEVPAGEEVKEVHNLRPEIETDASESTAHSFSDQVTGKRRRAKCASSGDCLDIHLEQKRKTKQRRQQQDAAFDPLEETTAPNEISTQPKAQEDQAGMSLNQIQGVAEETNPIVDKVIKISEVMCDITETDDSANLAKLDLQKKVVEFEQDAHPGGGSNGHTNSIALEDGVTLLETQKKILEVILVDGGQITECSQLQEIRRKEGEMGIGRKSKRVGGRQKGSTRISF